MRNCSVQIFKKGKKGMNLDRVKYKDGRAYLERVIKSGIEKGKIRKDYGQIIICQECNKKAFATDDNLKQGWGKFCSWECRSKLENNCNWKDGLLKSNGYIRIRKPEHPLAYSKGLVYEHRLIVEKQIGRYLHCWEICHHVNKIRDDNRPENLMLLRNKGTHRKFERGYPINQKNIIFDGRKLCKTEGVKNGQ